MKQKAFLIGVVIALFTSTSAKAQMFDGDAYWDDDDESTLIMGKWSQLYYELNVGWNVSGFEKHANFIYFGIGIGYPVNTKNAWRKFLPEQQIPSSEEEAELLF